MFAKTLIFILLMVNAAQAEQYKFEARVDRNKVYEGESLALFLTVSAESTSVSADDIKLPSLDGFEVMSSSETFGSRSTYINGQFKFVTEKTFRLILMPQKTGTLTIDPAEVTIKGESIKTQPIKVTVVAGQGPGPQSHGQAQRKGSPKQAPPPSEEEESFPTDELDSEAQDLFNALLRRRGFTLDDQGGVRSQPQVGMKDAFWIGVEASKKRVYVGEQVIVNWYLYTRGGIQQYEALKYPELKGFLKEDLQMATRLDFQDVVVNGVPYKKALLISYALYPLGPGQKKIDPYKAKATVVDLSSGMGVFGIGRPFYFQKASQELPLEVTPLPNEGRPASFSGAVGQFSITGSLGATQTKANQPVSLKIKFSGRGNVRAIEPPPLSLPPGIEVFDTKKDSQMQKNGEGSQEFEILLIPRTPGKVTISPIEVSYFDPEKRKYVSSRTPEFQLNVTPGDGSSGGVSVPLAQEEPVSAKPDSLDIKSQLNTQLPAPVIDGALVLLYLASLGFFGARFWMLLRADKKQLSSQIRKRIQQKLRAAQTALKTKDFKAVGIECSNAVVGTLGDLSGLGGASAELEQLLGRISKLTDDEKQKLREFMKECELLSFAPEEMLAAKDREATSKTLLKSSEALLSRLLSVAKREESSKQGASSSEGPQAS
ncbi:MAG: BatD family protein [Oligoflexia bacterium]|nr:BatD family protein [Oligoflexia bacterium]